jgi:hypothetical protein
LDYQTSGPLDTPIREFFGFLDEVGIESLHRFLIPAQRQMERIGEVEAGFVPIDNQGNERAVGWAKAARPCPRGVIDMPPMQSARVGQISEA